MDFYNFMQILDEDEHRQVTLLRLVKTRTSALGRNQTYHYLVTQLAYKIQKRACLGWHMMS